MAFGQNSSMGEAMWTKCNATPCSEILDVSMIWLTGWCEIQGFVGHARGVVRQGTRFLLIVTLRLAYGV